MRANVEGSMRAYCSRDTRLLERLVTFGDPSHSTPGRWRNFEIERSPVAAPSGAHKAA